MKKNNYQIHSVPRTFEQVAKQIVEYISEEQLKKGDQLPPERKLCELLQVSRSSIREGLRVLELLKYLSSKHGGGTFVAEAPPYLLPPQLLNQKLDTNALDHYFEIAIMAAEKIVFLNLGASTGKTEEFIKQEFWSGFSAFIVFLGAQLENPHYLNLWSDTYELLRGNNYFHNKKAPFSLGDFINFFGTGTWVELDKMFYLLDYTKIKRTKDL